MDAPDRHTLQAVAALVDRVAGHHGREPAPADPAAPLVSLGVDSLRLVHLIAELETAFGIEVGYDDVDLRHFATLGGVCALVQRYLDAPPTVAAAPPVPAPAGAADEVDGSAYPAFPVEGALLMHMAKLAMSAGDVRRASAMLRDPALDWGRFLDLATRHRVMNLVARNVERERLWLQDAVRHWTLRASYLYNRHRNRALLDELAVLLAAFEAGGVAVVVRKGTYLAARVYPDLALRYMVDLDVYVPDREREAFCATMAEYGYRQGMGNATGRVIEPLEREEAIFSRLHEAALPPFRRIAGGPYVEVFTIDPSHSLMPPAAHKNVPAADFLTRARREEVCGEPAWVCSPEDTLLDLGVHLYREATSVCSIEMGKDLCLIRFLDIVEWYRRARDTVDVDEVVALARRYDLGAELYYALHFTDLLYPGVLDPQLLRRLRPDDLAYLEEYGALEGLPGAWKVDFFQRLFDPQHGAGITLNP